MNTGSELLLLIQKLGHTSPSQRVLAQLWSLTDALAAPTANHELHERAAVAAITIDDEKLRVTALHALAIHGSDAALPLLRNLAAQSGLQTSIRRAALVAAETIAARGNTGGLSGLADLAGSLQKPRNA